MEKRATDMRLTTVLKWGLGGVVLWNLLTPEAKAETRRWFTQLNEELIAYQNQCALEKAQRHIQESLSDQSARLKPVGLVTGTDGSSPGETVTPGGRPDSKLLDVRVVDIDAIWRSRIVHPSVVLILGRRGSGKTALGYRLLELHRYGPRPYVVGVPDSARTLLPDWIGIAASLEEVPSGSIILVDETYLTYHARGASAQRSRVMSQLVNLSRQRGQTIIFVTQEARQVDKNIVSSADMIVFRDPGMLQVEFDRPELSKLAAKARHALSNVKGKIRRWSFVYAPDSDFTGLMENELPSFWKPSLSRVFAAGSSPPVSRPVRKPTLTERISRAREMRAQGSSYREIALELQVTRGTAVNYVRGYPYRRNRHSGK